MARKANRRTRRKATSRMRWAVGLSVIGIGGLAAMLLWPRKANASDTVQEQDATGGGPGNEGQIVKDDPWTLRTYPHAAAGTRLKIADNAQTRAFNNSARIRRDFRTTEGSWVVPIGHSIGHATGDSVKWQNIRFIKMRSQIEGQPLDTWAAANLVTRY